MPSLASLPHLLPENRVPLFYRGGASITAFRGGVANDGDPEDWIGSLRALRGGDRLNLEGSELGVSTLAGGISLKAAIEEDPVGWLGRPLASALGPSPGILVKLLDAGERLPVHYHPSQSFARANLRSRFGKAEGWVVMTAARRSRLWLGFREDMAQQQVRQLIQSQDGSQMLDAMVEYAVTTGDVFFVPPGVPHAIGEGVMVAELQEPTGFSIMLEYKRIGFTAEQATLGLGWDKALECLDFGGNADRPHRLIRPAPRRVLETEGGRIERLFGSEVEQFFQAERVEVSGQLCLPTQSFSILLILQGAGVLCYSGGARAIMAGQSWVVPYSTGVLSFEGELSILACLPPLAADDPP